MNDPSRALLEAGAVASVAATLTKILPPVAALFAIGWYGFQMWESPIGKRWRERWRRLLVAHQPTVEDQVMFAFLALAGCGALLTLVALSTVVVQ